MAQINLLKQSASAGHAWETGPKIFVRIFVALLIALVAYYAWLFFSIKNAAAQIVTLQNQISADKQTALSTPDRDQLLTRQLQIKDLQGIIAGHLYWSQLFKPLADVTLKTASYSSLRVGTDGGLTMNVTVPTLTDLDKYMQVFDLPQFNKNFSEVHISGFNKIQGKNSTAIQFSVKMKYEQALIKYQDPNQVSK